MDQADVRLRVIRASLRDDINDCRYREERLAALMRERDVHPDFHAQRVVDRVHLGLDIGPSLCARGRDIRHPDDDDRKQHDGHCEDQDRADDLGHTRLVLAEDGSHGVASRWAQGEHTRTRPDDI